MRANAIRRLAAGLLATAGAVALSAGAPDATATEYAAVMVEYALQVPR